MAAAAAVVVSAAMFLAKTVTHFYRLRLHTCLYRDGQQRRITRFCNRHAHLRVSLLSAQRLLVLVGVVVPVSAAAGGGVRASS